MAELECPGLPASWLNGWLAAVGTTVLVPELRLSWATGPSPHAVLSTDGADDPIALLVDAWPSVERVADMPIARSWASGAEFKRNPPVGLFQQRAKAARGHQDAWTLSSTLTDLYVSDRNDSKAAASHSRLDPPAPKGLTLHDRLIHTAHSIDVSETWIRRSLAGRGTRVGTNGLGFDSTRLTALGDESSVRVDPVVEILAFFSLALLPLRGSGTSRDAAGSSAAIALRPRSWHPVLDDGGRLVRRMHWPAWTERLGRFGIDALLDAWQPTDRRTWTQLGVRAAWASVEYKGRGQSDSTKGIGSEAL